MCRKLIYLVSVVLVLTVASGRAVAGVSYADPPGGWRYIYPGVGTASADAAALDGKWDHNNDSDVWDASLIGAGHGGILSLSEGGVDFLRVQDALTSGSGTDSRKIYFTHQLTLDPDMTQATADQVLSGGGITMSFRARLATTPPLDNLNGTTPWPPGGDGYGTHDNGKGSIGIHQEAGGDQAIAFCLSLATDAQDGDINTYMNGKQGLILNSRNGATVTGNVDATDTTANVGTPNVLELDPTQWHEFWVTIQPDISGGGTHKVTILMDGSMVASEFHVTAGSGGDQAYSYIGIGCGSTGQAGAIDVDFFAYKEGVHLPAGAQNKASQPNPADGSARTAVRSGTNNAYMLLDYTPGDTAETHTGYFSTVKADVDTRDAAHRLGSPPFPSVFETAFCVGYDDAAIPAFARTPLVSGTTYYWCVDEFDGATTWPGKTWSFTVTSRISAINADDVEQAYNPSPQDEAEWVVGPDVTLGWTLSGPEPTTGYILSYGVFWGTDQTAVATAPNTAPNGVVSGTSGEPTPTSYTAAGLPSGTEVFWRIDTRLLQEIPPHNSIIVEGTVWSFTTLPTAPISDPNLVGWWKLDGGFDDLVFDYSGHANHGTRVGNVQDVAGHEDGAFEFDGSSYVDLPLRIAGSRLGSAAFWIKTTEPDYGHMFYGAGETGGNGGGSEDEMHIDINTNRVRFFVEGGGADVTLVGPIVNDDEWHHIAGTWDTADEMRLYVDGSLSQAAAHTGNTFTCSAVVRLGRPGANERYYNGLLDDVRLYNKALSTAEVRLAAGLFEAYAPIPLDEAVGVATTPTLDWLPGALAASHNVYFGTVYADVQAGTGGTFKGNQPLANTTYVPSPALTAGKVYYWKITEVNDLHADKKWEGPVWVFRVAGGAGGLLGAYYHHTGGASPAGFETFILSRIDPEINYNWGDPGSPDPLVNVDDFSCRWTGRVEAPFSGDYTFYTATDDGARLWVDGQLLINQWVNQSTTEYASSPVTLVAGQKYDIVMEQYEDGGGATAYLRWSSPSTSKRIIPSIWLWPPTKASNPTPPDKSTGAPLKPTLSWIAGLYAAAANGHRVYFDADEAKVIARAGCQVNGTATTNPSYALPWTFGLEETFYWAVDEVNGVSWPGDVWSFTTANNKVVDDMESYGDGFTPGEPGNCIFFVWRDGWTLNEADGFPAGFLSNNTGASIGHWDTPYAETTIVSGGGQSMPYLYDNDGEVHGGNIPGNPANPDNPLEHYSRAKAEISDLQPLTQIGPDWTLGGAKALSLQFYGTTTNAIESMWVELTDSAGGKATVTYGDYADENPADINDPSWHQWNIDLQDFADGGVILTDVNSIAIGVGNEGGPAGGSGTVFFDDIRLYAPRCVLSRRSADFAALDYAPEASGGDCVINARELEIMTRDWLLGDMVVTPAARPTPDPNVVGWWKFDDGSGTTAIDSSGKASALTLSGNTWEGGISGGAVHFHGVGTGQGAFSYNGNAITVCAWVRHDDFISGQVERYVTVESEVAVIRKENDGRLHFYIKTDGSLRHLHVSGVLTKGQWHCVVGTWDGLTQRLYIDGVQRASQIPGGVLGAASAIRVSSSGEPFNGMLDDVRIYNYALTYGEVLSLAGVGTLYSPVPSPAELYYEGEDEGSRVINFKDYALLTDRWLEEDLFP